MKTKMYFVSARTTEGDDCSLFVEETSPENAKGAWLGWCDWMEIEGDQEIFWIFEVPALTGRSKTFDWGVEVKDVTP